MADRLVEWIFDQHRETNHKYDEYLPYEFHLKMVKSVGDKFLHLLPKDLFFEWRSDENFGLRSSNTPYQYYITKDVIALACYGHDLIEDTRVTYNDVKDVLTKDVADIIYALTNEKGKTRSERANDKYYEGIRNTKGAVFVKLCDRIANVQYSKSTNSSMFTKYSQENDKFIERLGVEGNAHLAPMFSYLTNLFKD